ncbi:hypothetical protein JXQ70_15950 [bacterium]|nr:hypothetical protein [bacterium]
MLNSNKRFVLEHAHTIVTLCLFSMINLFGFVTVSAQILEPTADTGVDADAEIMHVQEAPARSEVMVPSRDQTIDKKPRIIVSDVLYSAPPNKNSLLLSATATVILEERLKQVPGVKVITRPQTEPAEQPGTPMHSPESLEKTRTDELFDTVALGEIISFRETCLAGGLLLLGVRKMQYELTFSLRLRTVATGQDLFEGTASHTYIDKSIGFKRHNLELGIPAANKLLKPAINDILLELSIISASPTERSE